MVCDFKRLAWVYKVHPDLLGFLPLFLVYFFLVSSSTFSYFFCSILMGFSIHFEKNTCYLEFFFFQALFKLVFFMRIFAFELNISIKYFSCFVPITFETQANVSPGFPGSQANKSGRAFWASNGVFWFLLFWILLWICGHKNLWFDPLVQYLMVF